MEWSVFDITYFSEDVRAIALESGRIRVMVYTNSDVEINVGDKLSPLRDAFYSVNKNSSKRIKFTRAVPFQKSGRKE